MINFELTGDAQIIGVGNGDPNNNEVDKFQSGNWQRKLFSGKCQVIIQAGKTKIDIKLEATFNGIKNGIQQILSIT